MPRRKSSWKVGGKSAPKGVGESNQDVKGVYRDMLAEVESSPAQTGDDGRTTKKRRIRGQVVTQNEKVDRDGSSPSVSRRDSLCDSDIDAASAKGQVQPIWQQTTYRDGSDDSNESTFEWEEVEVADDLDLAENSQSEKEENRNLDLVLEPDGVGGRRSIVKRRPVTAAERKLRLEIHKTHLLCLLFHVHLRNHWCNDEQIHKVLYRRMPKKIVTNLDPDENHSQFRRDQTFKDGLQQSKEFFRDKFTVVARGLSRPYWKDDTQPMSDLPADLELPIQKDDFFDCARKLEGSRDVGAQLFCALLRSCGVDTRLVCSLQVLPLTTASKGTAPKKPEHRTIPIIDHNLPTSDEDHISDNLSDRHSSPQPLKRPIGSTGGLTRFSSPNPTPLKTIPKPKPPHRPTRLKESPFPVFWIEVFNSASQKWIPVDPLVTNTINKPNALCPPSSDAQNALTYVLSFSDTLTAKDVTRRYTTTYLAKTLRTRINCTPSGSTWLSRTLSLFRHPHAPSTAQDQLEDNELARKEAAEPMPRNVADFKDHPVYALERHLRRNEVIEPKRDVGKVIGGKNGKLESIYRRKDVRLCRSADKWYRLGREIKPGEQPLKRMPASRRRQREAESDDNDEDGDGDGEGGGVPLYAESQTTLYVPPPIPKRGAPIPKNVYGNLDIYTPTMVPAGGVHIPHPFTATAARLLSIDYADAVTGFTFKGRRGHAVVAGAVVWQGHAEAVEAVIEGLEYEQEMELEGRKRKLVLRLWKRWLVGLRIRKRVQGYEGVGERVERERMEMAEEMDEDGDGGGGFFPDLGAEEEAVPTAGRVFEDSMEGGEIRSLAHTSRVSGKGRAKMLVHDSSEDEIYEPGDEDAEEALRDAEEIQTVAFASRPPEPQPQNDEAGGFIPDDDDDDDDDDESAQPDITSNEIQNQNFIAISSPKAATLPTAGVDRQPASFEQHDQRQSLAPQRSTVPPESPTSRGPETADEKSETSMVEQGEIRGMSEEELAEARMLQQLYENGQMDASGSASPSNLVLAGVAEEDDPDGPQEVKVKEENNGEAFKGKSDEVANNAAGAVDSSTDDDDKGSLLSADPSDEDAEPEWLQ